MQKRIGILGGGLTGLTIASQLDNCQVLEKEPYVGGLCRSLKIQGFTFDLGGHIIFSKDEKILKFMLKQLGKNVAKRKRDAYITFNRFERVRYPLENNLKDLPAYNFKKAIISLLFNKYKNVKAENFETWLYKKFGPYLTSIYFKPYNQKIWKFDLKKMSTDWVEKIPDLSVSGVIKSNFEERTEGYEHQSYFYYPIEGGIQAYTDALAKKCSDIKTEVKIKCIKKVGNKWSVKTNFGTKHYDKLISTIPPQELGKVMDLPVEVQNAIGNLFYNDLLLLFVAMKKDNKDYTWMYYPVNSTFFHRVINLDKYSSKLAPKKFSSFIAEVTVPRNFNPSRITSYKGTMLRALKKFYVLPSYKLLFSKLINVPYAYVIYDKHHKKNMGVIRDYFASQGITLVGRFGEYEYLNMDQCTKRALEVVSELKSQK